MGEDTPESRFDCLCGTARALLAVLLDERLVLGFDLDEGTAFLLLASLNEATLKLDQVGKLLPQATLDSLVSKELFVCPLRALSNRRC